MNPFLVLIEFRNIYLIACFFGYTVCLLSIDQIIGIGIIGEYGNYKVVRSDCLCEYC